MRRMITTKQLEKLDEINYVKGFEDDNGKHFEVTADEVNLKSTAVNMGLNNAEGMSVLSGYELQTKLVDEKNNEYPATLTISGLLSYNHGIILAGSFQLTCPITDPDKIQPQQLWFDAELMGILFVGIIPAALWIGRNKYVWNTEEAAYVLQGT